MMGRRRASAVVARSLGVLLGEAKMHDISEEALACAS
jgi:hypothetical protein